MRKIMTKVEILKGFSYPEPARYFLGMWLFVLEGKDRVQSAQFRHAKCLIRREGKFGGRLLRIFVYVTPFPPLPRPH